MDAGRRRDTSGEYLPVTCLASGDAIAVTPVQDPARNRWGFDVWRLEAP